jgi:oligopeptide/dipeptide ABC transporter ATP-binding protein
VDGVDLAIRRGETLGLVGESGCGKSVTALSIMRLVARPNGRISEGHIWLHDEQGKATDVTTLGFDSRQMRSIRGGDVTMVFQEPMTSLNPSYSVGFQIMETVLHHQPVSKLRAREMAVAALRGVNMPDPDDVVDRYPHQLSGGMRQRVMLAMAMVCNPRLLIADEPTTALDVTVQAQILDLVEQGRDKLGMAILWITHDLGVVGELCERVLVMYLGQVVEDAPVAAIFEEPKHPYTQGLLACSFIIGEGAGQDVDPIAGSVPGPFEQVAGCPRRRSWTWWNRAATSWGWRFCGSPTTWAWWVSCVNACW